ncbi:hypothetical protein C7H19_19315 [Aphanothece hegewaldii CCALA 016]|uniref:Uncharacterized protein n=1 Tax=Aphanothece hegewaldii CCALA 016 TaxID=2107694 RepID=A0A2T1LTE4_9CHRO|nr:hypothetical protein [Aphanothece hegewaldii]PSF33874.1 hypothetical protein C7H19_19315 [Aphanothece hegewaldii CCALA 016]
MARRAKDEITQVEIDEILAEAGRDTTTISVTSITVEKINDEVEPLTDTEEKEKKRLEKKVERAFYEAGSALKELRDRKLYRNTHTTFEEYCRDRFGHSRQKSYYLIAGAEIFQNLSTNRCQILPTTEYQVRPLSVLEPPEQLVAWSQAVTEASFKVPPARLVREAVQLFQDKPHNIFEVSEVVGVMAKDNPKLRGKNGCWAIITAVHEFSCDLQFWNGVADGVRIEYIKELGYTSDECQSVQQLCNRIKRLLIRDDLEETAYAFLGILGKLKRSCLTELEDEMLFILERNYGIIKFK